MVVAKQQDPESQPSSSQSLEGETQHHTKGKAPKPPTTSSGIGMEKLLNKVPNLAPDGPLGTEKKGPLTIIGDPLGQLLSCTTKPLGSVLRSIGDPNGEALVGVRRQAVEEWGYDEDDRGGGGGGGVERLGGKEQTGENPLGL